MKKLGKLKLNQIEKSEMEYKEMNNLRGGTTCGCDCVYAGPGGSSAYVNMNANHDAGHPDSYGGPNVGCISEPGSATVSTF